MASKSLWGDLTSLETVRTPKSILIEQAGFLTNSLGGLVVAEVDDNSEGNLFIVDLDLHVPALNNYVYTLLRVRYGLTIYPVKLTFVPNGDAFQAESEEAFLATLERILTSADTRKILASLASQARQ